MPATTTTVGCANRATSKVTAYLKQVAAAASNGGSGGVTGSLLEELPPLQAHQVVLGRYLGSKTKPLNEATRIYRDVRKTTKRTKHFLTNEITALKQFITKRVRTELKNPHLPDVTFVVDIHKAEDAGKLDQLLFSSRSRPVLVRKQMTTTLPGGGENTTSSSSGDEIIFLEDQDDHFLKADLDSKKRPGKAATVASDSSATKKRKQAPTTTASSSSAGATTGATNMRLISPLQSMDSSTNCGSLKSGCGHGGGGAPSVITTATIKTDASSLSDRTPTTTAATTTATPTATAPAATKTATTTLVTTPPPEPAPQPQPQSQPFFQLESSNGRLTFDDLEEQVHQICENWIRQREDDGLEVMLRKANLVQSLQAYCGHYKRRLQYNPLADAPIEALRHLNEQQFVTILNTLGNSMMEWYNKYPTTCLEGEVNAWTGVVTTPTTTALAVPDHDDAEAMMTMMNMNMNAGVGSDADVDMEQGSIGTYSSLELELPSTLCTDDGVSDIVQCFEEFSMGSSTRSGTRGGMTPKSGSRRNEWSPVVREQHHYNQEDNNNVANNNHHGGSSTPATSSNNNTKPQLPPRWSKSRQLFQKRQQGHQFLQKQLRRFRNKKSSSSSSSRSNKKTSGSGHKTTTTSATTTTTTTTAAATATATTTAAAAVVAQRECSSTVRVSTKEELSLLYRRLRHNDPALKEAIVDFAIAQQEAKELIRVLGLSFYDWDMRRCTTSSHNSNDNNECTTSCSNDEQKQQHNNTNNDDEEEEGGGDPQTGVGGGGSGTTRKAFIVLKRSESSDWEDSSKNE